MTRSISRRLSVLFGVASLFVFTLVGVGLFAMMERQLFAELRATLDTRTKIAAMIVSHGTTAARFKITQDKLADLEPPDGSTRYHVDSADPAFRFGKPVEGEPDGPAADGFLRLRPPGSEYDVMTKTVALPASGERPALTLVVSTACERTQKMLRHIMLTLAALIAAATLATLLLSRAVTRVGLAPLARLSREAASLGPANRRRRLHTDALPRELHDLASSFNGALERIEHAHERLESFNADVAHELRTPVSILIGQTQVALARERSAERLRETLESNLEEFERLRIIVNDMLFLARRDRGERATDLADVSLAAEVTRMLAFLDMSFDDAQLRAELAGDARASVDPSLFGRAMTNLLINAIQHTRPDNTIRVTIAARGETVEIAVSNPGEPIDATARAHLFERFYRIEEARANSNENHGLGLSIVKAVAEMHGGAVFVSCERCWNTIGFSVAARPADAEPQAHDARTAAAGPRPTLKTT
ncbi:histidine kinase [Burkholderia savannae]|uniref:heavy metal sensor histidine kinase n=1 Tax=Burkholderia savannae TaxID=1637837 RepID=UPI00075CD4B9|nr:heavy metal sensor histidine kinase [Burkholderia savannae]AOJ83418.1 histidine kinase [Burkholderia savannae]